MIDNTRLIQTFKSLVKIDSPSGDEGKFAEFLEARFEKAGCKVERDLYGNLIAKRGGSGVPIILSAHLDTVEPGRGIKPQFVNGILKSDGSTILGGDAKAGISIILEALDTLMQNDFDCRPLEIVLTKEEETSLGGAKNLNYSKIKAKECIVFDGDEKVNQIYISSPTYYNLDATITGIGAHAGVEPEKGLSAIKIASQIIHSLPLGRIDPETTVNIGLIEGGSARNAVPETVKLYGEIRSRNKKTLAKTLKTTKSIFKMFEKKNKGSKILLNLDKEFEGFLLEADNPLIKKISKTLLEIGLKPELKDSGGGSDANIFGEHGIDVVIVGTGVYLPHTTREYVVVDEMADASRFCLEFIKAN